MPGAGGPRWEGRRVLWGWHGSRGPSIPHLPAPPLAPNGYMHFVCWMDTLCAARMIVTNYFRLCTCQMRARVRTRHHRIPVGNANTLRRKLGAGGLRGGGAHASNARTSESCTDKLRALRGPYPSGLVTSRPDALDGPPQGACWAPRYCHHQREPRNVAVRFVP